MRPRRAPRGGRLARLAALSHRARSFETVPSCGRIALCPLRVLPIPARARGRLPAAHRGRSIGPAPGIESPQPSGGELGAALDRGLLGGNVGDGKEIAQARLARSRRPRKADPAIRRVIGSPRRGLESGFHLKVGSEIASDSVASMLARSQPSSLFSRSRAFRVGLDAWNRPAWASRIEACGSTRMIPIGRRELLVTGILGATAAGLSAAWRSLAVGRSPPSRLRGAFG